MNSLEITHNSLLKQSALKEVQSLIAKAYRSGVSNDEDDSALKPQKKIALLQHSHQYLSIQKNRIYDLLNRGLFYCKRLSTCTNKSQANDALTPPAQSERRSSTNATVLAAILKAINAIRDHRRHPFKAASAPRTWDSSTIRDRNKQSPLCIQGQASLRQASTSLFPSSTNCYQNQLRSGTRLSVPPADADPSSAA